MAAKPLYRVIARSAAGFLCGVRTVSERGASFPTTCDLSRAAKLHLGEARRLAKWARAHGINATYQLIEPTTQPGFTKMNNLLSKILG
jgi:hypothetical protein